MRLQVSARLSKSVLPLDYRSGFASLLKEALHKANPLLFDRYYGRQHVLKPFTFSVYFPGLRGCEADRISVGQEAILHFSTASQELLIAIYNGLLEQVGTPYPLFDNNIIVQSIYLKPRMVIRESHGVFKTLAPVLVNTKGAANWYLLPEDAGFKEGLQFATRELARVFLGSTDVSVEFRPINVRRKVVRHYNMDMQGFVGIFELRGDPALLNLLYNIGLGVRRSQGFGMLELVRQGGQDSTSPSREERR
jgi:CRISPR-associated endoribonuclease Cas6